MYPYIFWVLFPGIPLAMTVMGVLAVDVGTDLIPAMGLGIEPPEEASWSGRRAAAMRRFFAAIYSALLLRSRQLVGAQLLRDLLLHGLGARRLAAGLASFVHAVVTSGFAISRSVACVPANFDGLFLSHGNNTDRQRALQALVGKLAVFAENFSTWLHRRGALEAIANWRPPHYTHRVLIDYHVKRASEFIVVRAFFALAGSLLLLPFRFTWMLLTQLLVDVERPLVRRRSPLGLPNFWSGITCSST